ncbi:MAG: RHS repeat-associated core domain-containing protein [Bryobacteraceae bacterium]
MTINHGIAQKFTSKERDAETGLDYFGARYFSAAQGRFTSPDWSAKEDPVPYAKMDDPQTLNLYSYVRNNPLSKADPDAHCPDACVVEGISVGVIVGVAAVRATAVYLATPSGQRSLNTFTSAFSSSVSSSISTVKGWFSSSSSSDPAPAAPGATPAVPVVVTGTDSGSNSSSPQSSC